MATIYKFDDKWRLIGSYTDATRNTYYHAVACCGGDHIFLQFRNSAIIPCVKSLFEFEMIGSTAKFIRSVNLAPGTATGTCCMAWDGEYLHVMDAINLMGWITNYYKCDVDGNLISSSMGLSVGVGDQLTGGCFNGEYLMLIDNDGKIIQFDPETLTGYVKTTIGSANSMYALAFDGEFYYTFRYAPLGSCSIYKYDENFNFISTTILPLPVTARWHGLDTDGEFWYLCK